MYNRLPDYQIVRMAVTLLVGFIFGSLAWKQGSDTATLAGVLNIAGLLFASTLFVGYTNSMTVQSAVEIQRWVGASGESLLMVRTPAALLGCLPRRLQHPAA